jgi:hypothetical protein
MDLGVLTIPALVVMGYLRFSIATGPHEIVSDRIEVPASVAHSGYSPVVATHRVADAYRELIDAARTAKHLRDFGLSSDHTVVGAIGDHFQLRMLVTAIRRSLGLI